MIDSVPRMILLYLAIISSLVICNHFSEAEDTVSNAIPESIDQKNIAMHSFIVPCPGATYVIMPRDFRGLPIGTPGLLGGMLFFAGDTICFGKEKNN